MLKSTAYIMINNAVSILVLQRLGLQTGRLHTNSMALRWGNPVSKGFARGPLPRQLRPGVGKEALSFGGSAGGGCQCDWVKEAQL